MNYFGKFDAKVSDALGQHPSAQLYSETVRANHVPTDAIVVPDAQLLFNADFKRTGVDLVLSGDGREVVLHDYFKGEHRAAIASPDGAHLTGDLVTALAGDVQYAQADGNSADAHKVIGHVTKLVGTATAVRNGVSIILNNGDNVEKGDVVSSGADSTLGITFIDGTVFGLSSNARMVLNEMVYDPNGSNNSSLLSLVAGTITFVAGETAKHGDMKVDTPVATMGIRGTAVLVEIDFSVPGATPDAKFQVLVEPDGTTGSYILFDKTTLTPLAVVDRAGTQINISNGIMSQTLAPLSPEIQKLINDVFTLKFTDNSNTKSLDHFTDSIVPTDIFGPFKFAGLNNNAPTIPVIVNLVVANSSNSSNGISTKNHVPEAPSIQSGPVVATITEQLNQTGLKSADLISGQIQYFDVNTTDHDTLSVKFSSFTYQNAKGQDVSGSLNGLQLKDIANVEAAIGVVEPLTPDAGGNATATWSYSVPDKAFDFLAAGEKLTLTYTATVDNNFQQVDQVSTPQTFTITITGTNDVPVITSSQQNIQFVPSGTDTKGGELIPDTATTGKLAFTDPDLTDTHTVSVKMASALLDGKDLSATVGQVVMDELGSALTAKITAADDSTGTGAGTIEWTLADLQVYLADVVPANETLVLTYAVTVTDSQGATDTQNIVVTIGGNQPAATVWIDTTPIPSGGVALWSDAANWESDKTPTINDDVFIGTDQMLPNTPVFPATIDADAQAKSLTMDYFTDFGTSIPELDVDSGVTLTIAGALKLDTSADSSSPLTAETIIKNWGTISVGGIAELLKHSVIDNHGTLILDGGGEFAGQSSITNSGTIEIASDTLDVAVDIVNSFTTTAGSAAEGLVANAATMTIAGTIEVNTGATLLLEDGGGIIGGNLKIASGGIVEITYGQDGTASANGGILDGVHVTNDGTIQVDGAVAADPTTTPATLATPAATLTLDDGTAIIGGDLTIASGATLDIEAGNSGPGPTLDGVTVGGTGGDTPSTIEIGNFGAATLLLDDGTTITSGNLTIAGGSTLDVEAGTTGHGATLHDVMVNGTSGDNHSTIEIGNSGAATLLLDDGTIITNGALNIAGGSMLDIEAGTTDPGATLDGASVTGTNATESAAASSIDVGASGAATLLLDDGTTITNGNLTISAGSAVDVEAGKVGPGATLDGVAVSGTSGDDPSTIAVGGSSVATLVLDDGTAITNGNLNIAGGSTLDIEAGRAGPGATLDGVSVNGTDADAELSAPASVIDVGNSGAATLLLDDGTTITGGDLTIASGSTVDIESVSGATLDGVTVSGTNDPSTIEIGKSGGATLLLDDGTTITNGNLTIAGGSTLDVEAAASGPGATLDGVAVSGTSGDSASVIEVGVLGAATLLLDDGTTVTNGNLNIVGGSTLDVEAGKAGPGATLDGVTVHGTDAIDMIAASTIEVGNSGAATLTLSDGTTITNGDLTIADGSTLESTGSGANVSNFITNVAVDNSGTLESTVGALKISGGTITNSGILDANFSEIDITSDPITNTGTLEATVFESVLTLTNLTVTNTGGAVSDDFGATINLAGSTVSGGAVDIDGTLDSTGTSLITNATITNSEILESSGGTLTISGGSITNSDTLEANGGTLDITSDPIANSRTIEAIDKSVLKLTTLTVTNTTGGSVTDTFGSTIDLASSTISGGSVYIAGTLDSTGTSFITNATVTNSEMLESTGGTLTIGGGSITNSGTLEANGGALDITGDPIANNAGTLQAIDNSVLTLTNLTVTNTGGTVSDAVGSTIDLAGSTITGSGVVNIAGTLDSTGTSSISVVQLFKPGLINSGTLEVTSGVLSISGIVANTGTLEALDDSVLTLTSATVTNTAGTVSDTLGSTVNLASTTVSGGTIDVAGALNVTVASEIENATVDGGGDLTATAAALTLSKVTLDDVTLAGSFTNADTLTIDDTVTLDGATISGGTIDDTGTLKVTAASEIENATVDGGGDLTAATAALTLSGVTLDDVTLSGSFTNADTLTIDDTVTLNGATISGGTIDDKGNLSVSSASEIENATVDGGGDLTATAAALTLSGVTLDGVTLSGNFTNADTLTIDDTVTLDGATISGGTIDDKGNLSVSSASEIENATVDGGGDLTATAALTLSKVTLDDVTLSGSFTNADTLTIDDTVTLNDATISGGTIDDTGTLKVTAASEIENATVDGGGDLTATAAALTLSKVTLDDVTLAGSFTNADTLTIDDTVTLNGATISGGILNISGTLDSTGTNFITGVTIDNSSNIDVLSGTLTIDPATFTNTGTVDVENTATLVLSGETVNNASGKFETSGTGLINLVNSTITSGTLAGTIDTATGNKNSTLSGVTLALGTLVTALVGVLELTGSITNNGEIDASTGSVDFLGTTVTGGTLGGSGTIATASGNVDSTLSGVTIADGSTVTASVGSLDLVGTITNNGTIDVTSKLFLDSATVDGGTLAGAGQISTGAHNIVSVLEGVTVATGTKVTATIGTLELTGTIADHGEIDATTGLLYNATVDGGTLGGGGTFATAVGTSNTLDDVTIASGTTVAVTDGTTLDLIGTITGGTITLDSSGDATQLELSGDVTLTGGAVTMTDSAKNSIVSDGSAATLTNSDTISGAGTIGDSHLTLTNNGTIDATGTHSLVINTGVTNDATGVLEASAGHTLNIDGNVTNDGTIETGASAHVTITGNVVTDTGVTGAINIAANATVEIGGTVDAYQTVNFGALNASGQLVLSPNGAGELILDDPSGFKGVVNGLLEATDGHENHENYIDLKNFADTTHTKVTSAVYDSDTGVTAVTITNGTSQPNLTINLSGDYHSRDIEFASDGHGGTLFSDPAADSGAVTIDSGHTLDIGGASSATVTFANSAGNTGELVLGDSHDFTGTIAGFAGDGTIANSDLIDVADVNFVNVATDKTTYAENAAGTGGTLTLYDANGHTLDSLNFAGNYQLANFTIENDGNGGTLVVDPPVTSPAPAGTVVASAANQTLSGTAPSENFVFNFANVGQSTISNFHAATDTLQLGAATFADAQAAINAVHDDGHGNAVLTIDAHDSITLTGVLKAQLHVNDFHIV